MVPWYEKEGGNSFTMLSSKIRQHLLSSETSMAACVGLPLLTTMGCRGKMTL